MSTTSLMTFEEFERLTYEGKAELIDGEVITMPPPKVGHMEIMIRVFEHLRAALPAGRVWPDRGGYRVGKGWLEPDVSVSWPDQRMEDEYFVGSPMVAVEILSPRDRLEQKLTLFFAHGAMEVWVIDPRHKSMTVYAKEDAVVVRLVVDGVYHSPALSLTISLSTVFGG
jgi:Uma2 family endonuclease